MQRRKLVAYTVPMVAFAVLLGLGSLLRKAGVGFWFNSPEYWIYPTQTLVCGALILWYWREYQFGPPRRILFTTALALLVFALWIAPQEILGLAPRRTGFDPETFASQPVLYWATIGFRFVRLVLVVPLIEEVFFRGFLLRYFIREEFHVVPIGAFSWTSFAIVAIGFGLIHSPADWVAGLIAGALYNAVAYRSKSLTSCVLAHAITNLLLGIWIMTSRQWGFW